MSSRRSSSGASSRNARNIRSAARPRANQVDATIPRRTPTFPNGPAGAGEIDAAPPSNGAAPPSSSPPARPPRINKPYHRVVPYEYLDANGDHFTWTYRYEDEDGKRVDTRQTRNEDTPGGPCPLYRLPSLLANSEKPILVCEGEKSADCAQDIFGADYEATTSKQGAKSPGKSDWRPTKGRRVVIWPDADDNGHAYAAAVKDLCLNVGAASVEIVDVAGLPKEVGSSGPATSRRRSSGLRAYRSCLDQRD